jgi:hypothetical protein
VRYLFTIVASIWLFTAAARADGSSIAGQLPDNVANLQAYLFQLKKNGISLRISPQAFCTQMGYGTAILGSEPEEVDDDHKKVPGQLDWVVCQFPHK